MIVSSRYLGFAICCALSAILALPCFAQQRSVNDEILRGLLAANDVMPLPPVGEELENVVELGRSLFFDRELSGNRDVSCATCHHPSLSSGDSRQLSSGVGGDGLGSFRTQEADRDIVPRNAPDLFHRGDELWNGMFWDSRVAEENGQFLSPAGTRLPAGLTSVLAVQAMFPVTSRVEMRGNFGDLDINGDRNELASIDDDDLSGIWGAITDRLLNIPAYREAFADAFPELSAEDIGFQHAAEAIAVFERVAFTPRDSAWDRYLDGDNDALEAAAKRGATHFLQAGSCATCHSGSLLTDQQHHNIGIPQIGPGMSSTGLDLGRVLETGLTEDEFAFRTPQLRNVILTGPWMHNGAFASIEDVVRHYDPETRLTSYDVDQLPEHLRELVHFDQATMEALSAHLDPKLPRESLTSDQVDDLMAFLFSLTSPTADLMLEITPVEVLSGLEVERLPASPIAFNYDQSNGTLQLAGEDSAELDAIFLRIDDAPDGDEADFTFVRSAAPWSGDERIVLSDELYAQSFIDYRSRPSFLFRVGDDFKGMLPVGLSVDDVQDHLTAAYRIHGSPELRRAQVRTVPEPSSLEIFLATVVWVTRRRRDLQS